MSFTTSRAEPWRLIEGSMATTSGKPYGAFLLPGGARIIAAAGEGWEHVSVSFRDRAPSWSEMHGVKQMFWDADDAVMQLHPPEKDYVNCHPYCLHMWRPIDKEIPLPPSWMVGPKS